MKQSGIDLFGKWLKNQDWEGIFATKDAHSKAEFFHNMLLKKLEECLPSKIRKVSSDDQPFCTEKMKKLKRLKSREFNKNRRSIKWTKLNTLYKTEVSKAKKIYYKNILKDLKQSDVRKWYSKLKYLCSYDQKVSDPIIVEEIKHLTDQEQAEEIASFFSKISQEYEPLQEKDIDIPSFSASSVPSFLPSDIEEKLLKIKTNKSVPSGDICLLYTSPSPRDS